MYCPQCGQHQVSETTRFCSRCGFPLEGVTAVIAAGGQVPTRYIQNRNQPMSPRSKGVRQGAMLMLSTLLVVPLVSIVSVNFLGNGEVVIPMAALICFVGGLLRILYALLMEDAVPPVEIPNIPAYTPGMVDRSASNVMLPPASNAAPAWGSRPKTAEIYQPPSITENTTRLLDKDDPNQR